MNNETLNKKGGKGSDYRFLSNAKYYTICVYTVVTVLICAALIKAMFMWDVTSAWLSAIIHWGFPYLFGVFVALLLFPLVLFLEDKLFGNAPEGLKKHKRALSVLIIYVAFIGMVAIGMIFIIPQLTDSISTIIRVSPIWYNRIVAWVEDLNNKLPNIDMEFITTKLENFSKDFFTATKLQEQLQNIVQTVWNTSVSIVGVAVNIFITLIISIYLLLDTKSLYHSVQRLLHALLPEKMVEQVNHVTAESYSIFSKYVTGKLIDSMIIGVICFFAMNILQLPYTLIISVIVAITNMIPYFGPYIGAVPGAIIMLMVSPMKMLIYLIMIVIIQQFDGLILGPKILGDSTGLGPAAIIFSVSAGGAVAGVLGMFVGVPVVAIISHLCGIFVDYRLGRKKERGEISEACADTLKNPELEREEVRKEKELEQQMQHQHNHHHGGKEHELEELTDDMFESDPDQKTE